MADFTKTEEKNTPESGTPTLSDSDNLESGKETPPPEAASPRDIHGFKVSNSSGMEIGDFY